MNAEAVRTKPEFRKEAIRKAMKRAHPDTGGSYDGFIRVKKAVENLEAA